MQNKYIEGFAQNYDAELQKPEFLKYEQNGCGDGSSLTEKVQPGAHRWAFSAFAQAHSAANRSNAAPVPKLVRRHNKKNKRHSIFSFFFYFCFFAFCFCFCFLCFFVYL